MILYTQQQLDNLQKHFTKSILSALLVVPLGTIINIVLCFFVTDANAHLLQAIVTFVSIIIGWYALGCIFLSIVPLYRQIVFIKSILSGTKQTVSGKVAKVGETITFSKITMIEVVIADAKNHVCYLQSGNDVPFAVNDIVSLQVVNDKIFSYEVTLHE